MLLLLTLMFGVIETSMAVYSFHFVANAAHEATRYAIVRGSSWNPTTCDGTGSAGSGYGSAQCQASAADIQNFVATRNFPGVNITAGDVCVEYFSAVPSSVSTSCTSNSTPNAPGDIVQVTVTYPFTFNVPGFPAYTVSLSSTSQSVIAQ